MNNLKINSRVLAFLLVLTTLFATVPLGSITAEAETPTAVATAVSGGGIKNVASAFTASFYILKGVTAAADAITALSEGKGIGEAALTAVYSFIGKTYDPDGDQTPLYYKDYMNSLNELKSELLTEFDTVNANIAAVSDKIEAVANEEYINNFLLQYNGGYVNLANNMMMQYKNLSSGFEQGFATDNELKTAYDQLYSASKKLENHLSYFLLTGVLSNGKMTTIQELLYGSFGEDCYEYVRSLYETYTLSQYFLQLCSIYHLNYCAQTNQASYSVTGGESFFATNIPSNILTYNENLKRITAVLGRFYTTSPKALNVNVGGTDNYTVISVSDNINVAKNDVIHLPSFAATTGALFDTAKMYYDVSSTALASVTKDGLVTVKGASGSFSVTVRYDSSITSVDNSCYTLNFTIGASDFSGGLGTEAHPYLVTTASDFKKIFSTSNYYNKHFFLGADIDLGGEAVSTLSTFAGVIDGNGHRVYNFNAVNLIDDNQGTIKNLTLGHPTASTTISKTYNEQTSVTQYIIGVLVANNNGTVTNCVMNNVTLTVNGTETDNNEDFDVFLGGLIGYNYGTISGCMIKNSEISISLTPVKKSGDNIFTVVGGITAVNFGGVIDNVTYPGIVETSVCRSTKITASVHVWGSGIFNKSVPTAYASGIVGGNYGTVRHCATYGGSCSVSATGEANVTDASAIKGTISALNAGTMQYCYGSGVFADKLTDGLPAESSSSFSSDSAMGHSLSLNGPLYEDISGLPLPDFVTGTAIICNQNSYGILGESGFNTAGLSFVMSMKSGNEIKPTHFRIQPTANSTIGEKSVTVYYGSDSYAKHTVNIPCPHNTTYTRPEKIATCNTDGYTEGVYCNDCETWISGNVTRPKLQTHSFGSYSGLSSSEHKRTCLICGEVEQGAHQWNSGETLTYPTHLTVGTVKYSCLLCPYTKTETLPTVGDHVFGAWKNATSTKHYRECPCGETEYADHTWNAGEITLQPTHLKEGTKLYTCTGCGATKTESISTLSAHAFGDWRNYSDLKHSRECPCGETEYADHTWNAGEITLQPTHMKEGTKRFTCTGCGATKTETIPTLTDHVFGAWKSYSEGKHSRECPCGKTEYGDHAWDEGEIVLQPTHMKEGTRQYACETCGATKAEAIPKTQDHEYSPWKSYSELLHSRDCACGVSDYGNHQWGDGIPKKQPTHVEEGETMYICSVCNATKTETLPKLPEHNYIYTVITPATATQSGMGKYTCACGDFYTAVIPAREITLTGGKVFSKNGNTVSVTVEISKNCGFSYLRFTLDYDKSALTLVSVQNGEIVKDMDAGVNLLWSAASDATATGALVTLTFEVSPYAAEGDYTVDFISRECYNAKGEEVGVNFLGSSVTLMDYLDGDANGDGAVNGKDIMIMRKYFATLDDNTGVSGVKLYYGADANGDGTVDGRDLILLRQYMAYYDDETGRSEITLGAASTKNN